MNVIYINGVEYALSDEELGLSLMRYLRERRFLRGAKNGCEAGLCGSCTVVADGKPVRSCKATVGKYLGASVITIEGMEHPDGSLHPIQRAFLDAGAVQCGFCTPGMVMGAYALLLKDPSPDREAIKKAMRGHLCRCTGYQQIVDAVELAARLIREQGLSLEPGCIARDTGVAGNAGVAKG